MNWRLDISGTVIEMRMMIVEGPDHGRYCTVVVFRTMALVLSEGLSVPCVDCALVNWEQVRMLWVGLGFYRPLETGFLSQCV